MSVNTRVIDNENNRSLYVGDVVEGQDAREQVALGNAEKIAEAETPAVAVAAPVEEAAPVEVDAETPAVAVAAPVEEAAPVEVDATQAAIDHAEAMGIDIATIQGSGKDGKVTKADVEAAIAQRG